MNRPTPAAGTPLSFLGVRLPPSVRLRVVAIVAGGTHRYDPADWRDALVVVERGQIELSCCDGSRLRFGRGAVLYLERLPLHQLYNPHRETLVLVAVSRQAGARTQCITAPPRTEPG